MASLEERILSRLRTCRYAGLPPSSELLDDAISVFESITRKERMRAQRDLLIRRAALLYPAERPWGVATRLCEEAKRLHRVRDERAARDIEPASVQACLQAARYFHPLPASARQFYRVLTEITDTPTTGGVS